jgi:hypothetical protein
MRMHVPEDGRPEDGRPDPRGEAMVTELKWVHDMIRQDLAMIQHLAADTAAGEPASTIRRGVRALASASPIWQLKAGCLRHCRFVHSHHSHQANPALNPVVDKLEADHQHVATLLDEVEAATEHLTTEHLTTEHLTTEELAEPAAARDRLVGALGALSTDLLAHLAFEEEHIASTLRTFTRWPGW